MIINHTTPVSSVQAPTTAIRNGSPLLDRRVDEASAGLVASFAKQLHSVREDNAEIIVEYVAAMKSEVNLSDHYRRDLIALLCKSPNLITMHLSNILSQIFLDSWIISVGQKHKTLCTNGWALTIFTENVYYGFSSGSIPDTEPDRRPVQHY